MCFSICAEIRYLISFEPEMSAHTSSRLGRDSFNRPTLHVSRNLLGKFIVRREQDWRMSAMLAEVEAYKGPRDRAAHTHGGRRTARVEPLYGDGGTVYVYLVYGLHWLLNFCTAGAERPEGVLIRAILAETAGRPTLIAGPGKVCNRLHIDKRLDGADATCSAHIWLEGRAPARGHHRLRRGAGVHQEKGRGGHGQRQRDGVVAAANRGAANGSLTECRAYKRTGRAAAKHGRRAGGSGRHRGNKTPAGVGALRYRVCAVRSVFMRCFVRDLCAVSAPSKHLLRMGACVARQSIKA